MYPHNTRRKYIRCTGMLLILMLVALGGIQATTTSLSADPPELILELAWEGAVRVPGWTEVQVALATADMPWHGDLVLKDRQQQITYRITVDLPASGRRFLRLPLYVSEFTTFSLELVAPGETSVATYRLPLRAISTQNRLCVAVDALGRLMPGKENGCASSLLLTDLGTLPETAMAWDAIDVLVFHDIATTALTPAQRDALLAWVNLGGQLTIAEGPGLAQTLAGLPQPLQQIITELSAGATRPWGAGFISRARRGHSDTATTWLGDWSDNRVPAISLLAAAIPLNTAAPDPDALAQVPRSQVPSLGLWLILLPLYATFVGPGAWWIAKRLKNPALAWVLAPAGIVLGTIIMMLGLTSTGAGAFPVTHEIAVIFGGGEEAPGRVLQTTAIFAPRARNLAWNSILAPRPFWGYMDETTSASYFPDNRPFVAEVMWETSGARVNVVLPPGPLTWAAEGLMNLPEIEAQTTLSAQQGGPLLTGSIHSAVQLHDVTLIFEDGMHRASLAQTVAAKTLVQFTMPLQPVQTFDVQYNPFCPILSTGNYFYPRSAAVAALAPVALVAPTPCYLTAITSGVPFPTQNASAERVEESCLVIAIPCPTLEGGGIPLLPRLDVESAGYGWLDDSGMIHVSGTSPVILAYVPLQSVGQHAAFAPLRLTVRLDSVEIPLFLADFEIWDWSAERWLQQSIPTADAPLTLEGDTILTMYDHKQGVRVRLTPNSNDPLALTLSMVLEPNP